MDIDKLTEDELRDRLRELQGAQAPDDGRRTVNVDGLDVTVDLKAARGWNALLLFAKMQQAQEDGDTATAILAFTQYCDVIMHDSMPQIIEHLGGDSASVEAVVSFLNDAMNKAGVNAKN